VKDIIIIGAGGVGRETAMLIEDINRIKDEWRLLGYVDDNQDIFGKFINGYKVIGNIDWLNTVENDIYVVCTVSNPIIKHHIINKLMNSHIKFANLIHPTAVISKHVDLGQDLIIQAYCVITTNVAIGNHVQLNPQCGIGHDSKIGDYSSLYWNVNISGNVKIGEGCTLGTKSTIIQGKEVGEWSIIGLGSNIIQDIPEYCTAVGNPAKPIKFHKEV